MTGKQQTILNARMIFNAFGFDQWTLISAGKVTCGLTMYEVNHIRLFGLLHDIHSANSRAWAFRKNPYSIYIEPLDKDFETIKNKTK